MRIALLIFVTLLVSFNASWLLWRDRLTPTTLITPTPLTALQRQFGTRMRAPLAGALERPLPHDFEAGRSLRLTLERLGEVTGVRIVVDYRNLNRLGGVDESAPLTTPIKLARRPLRDALPALLASVPSGEPLGVEADSDSLIIDVRSRLGRDTATRVYDIRDLLPAAPPPPPPATNPAAVKVAADAFVAAVRADVASHTWSRPHIGDDFSRVGRIRHLAGQLIVQHTPAGHNDVVEYLNRIRIRRARWDFATRAGALTSGSLAAVLGVVTARRLLARRAALRAGLCRRCGYDLRASSGRCPECGTSMATPNVSASVAPTA